MAADKYLVDYLGDNLIERIKNELNESNCCLIYDQLVKLPKEEKALNRVRNLIEINSEAAFNNEFFTQITLDTLIDILEMKCLLIDEIDVLVACSKWVDAKVKRQKLDATIKNKQKIFAPLKSLIKFKEIKFDEIIQIGTNLRNLLCDKDITSLFLHLVDETLQLEIECKTLRTKPKIYSVSISVEGISGNIGNFCKFELDLTVNQSVVWTSIQTSFRDINRKLELNVYENKNEMLNLKHENILINDEWCFKFKNGLRLDVLNEYKLSFISNQSGNFEDFCKNFKFKLEEDDKIFEFELSSKGHSFHCIKKIEFCASSYILD